MINTKVSPPLTTYQTAGIFFLIINFWYSGVLLVANISYYLHWTPLVFLILSLSSIPLAYYSIRGVKWFLRLTTTQTTLVVSRITIAVTLLHILALYYIPSWYTVSGEALLLAEGWLLLFSITVLAIVNQYKYSNYYGNRK